MKVVSTRLHSELEISGNNVVIRKRGVAHTLASGLNGDRAIAISTITAVQFRKGDWISPGYILFSYAGSKPFRGGIIEATQDPDAFIFEKALNEQVEQFKNKVGEIMRSPKPISPSVSSGLSDELMKLATMKENGILTEAEFEAAKKKLLS